MKKRSNRSKCEEQLMEQVGRSVEIKRKAAGLTQKQLAGVLDMSASWITLLENGKTAFSFYQGMVLANLLGLDLDRLSIFAPAKEEKERLAELALAHADEIDEEIKAAETKLKALQERKRMAARATNAAPELRKAVL